MRSKSMPPKKAASPTPKEDDGAELGEEVEILPPTEKKTKKKTRKSMKKRAGSSTRPSIANRPEWNNDTHIDGYDDLDENGKVKRQGVMHTLNGEKSRKEQEDLNQQWMESLRS